MNVLVVRLGALGDIVHTIPAVAALRRAFPADRLDWVVDARHAPFVELVRSVNDVVPLERGTRGWIDVVRRLRGGRYDAALDFQGLMKSAVIARVSGAARVVGFSIWHLREKGARPFYSEVNVPGAGTHHVIRKNLALLGALGVASETIEFPLRDVPSPALDVIRSSQGGAGAFALINPGAAWPNKRWPPGRFGEVAAFLRDVRGLPSYVLWGPGEAPLAQAVIDASGGAARLAPPTTTVDLVALVRAAAVMVSGDTGPLHIAAAAGTPAVAIHGPTDPARNGPWAASDVAVSRYAACGCHYERRCRQRAWCLEGVTVPEVTAAIQRRLAGTPAR
jgi:lipopolysaccharide heptosyltransferase I